MHPAKERRTTTTKRSSRRVGIDFGGTIGFEDKEEPIPQSFPMMRHLVHKYGASNVFVVSKAGPAMVEKTKLWFQKTEFFERTGLAVDNVIFVRECEEKAGIVQSLNISIFFDDSYKVVRCLAPLPMMERIFWMSTQPEQIKLIERKYRDKIAMTKRWGSTMKFFQKCR